MNEHDTSPATCVECGDELLPERAKLGYDYCLKKDCQAKRRRGVSVTAVNVNKSGDVFVVGDEQELSQRAQAGEFAKRNPSLGTGYRAPAAAPVQRSAVPRARTGAPARRPWTEQQEKLVRLYHEMGLSPRQIVERAHANAPRLGLTERLVVKILSAPRR